MPRSDPRQEAKHASYQGDSKQKLISVSSPHYSSRNQQDLVNDRPCRCHIIRAVNSDQDVSWDPEGLFKNHTDRVPLFKEKSRDEPGTSSDVPSLDPAFLRKYPIRPLKGTLSDLKRFKRTLEEKYMPIDVDHPNVSVLHLDPPIFLVDKVYTDEECDDVIGKLAATGRMAASTVGAGNLYGTNVSSNSRRTSSSVLINDEMMDEFPEIKEFAECLQRKAFDLLQGDTLGPWGRPGHAMLHQQWAFEGMQAAVYKQGQERLLVVLEGEPEDSFPNAELQCLQHFLEHEDAFPAALADENRFQRHATVLLYLNTVESGGETTFSHLDVSVKPQAGSILVFFPAFANGEADHRTLHIAREAVDEKWVVQQWVARGYNSTLAAHAEQQGKHDDVRTSRKALKKKKSQKKTSPGFG